MKTNDEILAMLCNYYENSADAMRQADEYSERDRDYYDNKQLTATERDELRKRNQPDVIKNRIKPKIDFLLGTERSNRTDPKAYPRTPMDDDAANAATDAIRYVCDREDFAAKRSTVFENMVIEGTGGAIVEVKQERSGRRYVCIKRIAWDRLFYDHHSRERDFSDALFKGLIWWGDKSEAVALYGENVEDLFVRTLAIGSNKQDDKPSHWSDGKRKRVMFAEVYYLDSGTWMHAIYTKAGFIREPHVSEYLDDEGSPCCPLEFMSCYVDRENNRYGVVRQLIGPQDEINKRSSKALHLLTMRQFKMEKGAADPKQIKKEAAKPDGILMVEPGMLFELVQTNDMAQGNLALLQEAKLEIDASGANAALAGKDNSSSGKELALKQAGGLTELGPVFDSLRIWQRNIYKQIWYRIKQYWDTETWVRVTDDENAPRFVGLNVTDPATGQIQNHVASMDLDIILDESPDTVTVQQEQFETLGELYKVNPQTPVNPTGIPFDVVFEASQVRNKQKILDRMRGVQPGNPMNGPTAGPAGQPPPEQAPMQPPQNALAPAEPMPPPPDPAQVIGQIMQQAIGQLEQIGQQIAQGAQDAIGAVQGAAQEAAGMLQSVGQQTAQGVQQAGQEAVVAIQQAGKDTAQAVQLAGAEAVSGVQGAAGQAMAQVSSNAAASGVAHMMHMQGMAKKVVRDPMTQRIVGIEPVQ